MAREGRAGPRRRPVEPFLWLLFSGGGMAAAVLVPVLVLLFGVVFPLAGGPPYDHLRAVAAHPLTRVALLGLAVLAFFHWAHRFRFAVEHGLGLGRLDRLIAPLCYGAALAGSAAAAHVLFLTL
ncbi:fumarate reductase subunit D [Bailinhaonella thermotolerans]|uniref:Fumarate reductase subunit D n=1 Tax=Bailinhaonella thermotolerans TaxID=1070861 RepID=A0A3A4B1N7_9ACTN|nr:fumarate reductase subunit D [Bailinhaonella thermotolerans]RJL34078.1 fumarate reductase subunit D [Bailinhaonella thermotolerans]